MGGLSQPSLASNFLRRLPSSFANQMVQQLRHIPFAYRRKSYLFSAPDRSRLALQECGRVEDVARHL